VIAVLEKDLNRIDTPGGNVSAGIATPSRGAREISVIQQTQQPGGANPSHWHDREEAITVLSGRVAVSTPDETINLAAGDSVIIPPKTLHRLETTGEERAEGLLIAPAGIRYIHENGEAGNPPWAR
jgi:quercetin dioxygenase-like cupin family protein